MTPIIRKAIISPRGKFEIYLDSNEEYRWHIISSNGKTIGASSEGFSSKAYCIENAKLELLGILDFFKQLNKPIPLKSINKPISILNKKLSNLSPKLIKNI